MNGYKVVAQGRFLNVTPYTPDTTIHLLSHRHGCMCVLSASDAPGCTQARVQPYSAPASDGSLTVFSFPWLQNVCVFVLGICFLNKCLSLSVSGPHVTFLMTMSELCHTSLRVGFPHTQLCVFLVLPVLDPSDFLWPSENSPEKILGCGKRTGWGYL